MESSKNTLNHKMVTTLFPGLTNPLNGYRYPPNSRVSVLYWVQESEGEDSEEETCSTGSVKSG